MHPGFVYPPALAIDPAGSATEKTEVGLIDDKGFTRLFAQGGQKQFKRGEELFNNETVDGNGRTCATCHINDSKKDNFDFMPEDAQDLFAEDPMGPLFRLSTLMTGPA